MDDLNRPVPDIVSGPDDLTSRHAAASHHHDHGVRVVAAPVGVDAAAAVVVGRPPELPAHH